MRLINVRYSNLDIGVLLRYTEVDKDVKERKEEIYQSILLRILHGDFELLFSCPSSTSFSVAFDQF